VNIVLIAFHIDSVRLPCGIYLKSLQHI